MKMRSKPPRLQVPPSSENNNASTSGTPSVRPRRLRQLTPAISHPRRPSLKFGQETDSRLIARQVTITRSGDGGQKPVFMGRSSSSTPDTRGLIPTPHGSAVVATGRPVAGTANRTAISTRELTHNSHPRHESESGSSQNSTPCQLRTNVRRRYPKNVRPLRSSNPRKG